MTWRKVLLGFFEFLTLGPKTNTIVTEVLSWVLTKPRKYFMSGPACGKMIRLKIEKKRFYYSWLMIGVVLTRKMVTTKNISNGQASLHIESEM